MTLSVISLFCGGGVKTLGAMQAGYTPVLGVEMSPEIAAVYSDNIGAVTVAKVEDVDPRPYAGIDLLLASPVCTRASVANANRGETGVDAAAAEGVCRWLREARPERFVMENVTQYREFDSCKAILRTLTELGYWWSADNCNFADYAVPQTRRRLVVRAIRDAMLPALPAPTPWIGWYAAIEDILHTLPESRFAPWQLARLPANLFESTLVTNAGNQPNGHAERQPVQCRPLEPSPPVTAQFGGRVRALLIEGDAAGDRPPTCGTSAEPSFTLKGATGGRVHRAFIAHPSADNDRFLVRAGDEPVFTLTNTAGTPRAFLVSDNTEASGEGVGVRHSHAPAGTVRTNSTGGTSAKAFLADCGNPRAEGITVRGGDEPAHTVTSSAFRRPVNDPKAWLEQGRVVSLTPRALARLQTLPDTYRLPESRRLACQIIGNGFSTEAARRIIGGLS